MSCNGTAAFRAATASLGGTDAKAIVEYVKTEFEKLKSDQSDELEKLCEDFRIMRNKFTQLHSTKFREVDNLKQQVLSLEGHIQKLEDCIRGADVYEQTNTIFLTGRNLPGSVQGEYRQVIIVYDYGPHSSTIENFWREVENVFLFQRCSVVSLCCCWGF